MSRILLKIQSYLIGNMSKWDQIKQNIIKFKERISAQVFLAGLVLSIMFFLLLSSAFKTHTAKIEILFTAKSETAALQSKQILNNLMELPKTLNFYERLLKNNSDVRDIAEGEKPAQRKNIWNNLIAVKKIEKNSSMFEISITARREADAKALAQKTARNLFDMASGYYDVKKDIDLRIVDGPILHTNFFAGFVLALVLSLIFGFAIAFVLQKFLRGSRTIFANSRQIFAEKNWFDFSKKETGSSEEEKRYLESLYAAEQMQMPFEITLKNEKPETKKEEEAKKEEVKFEEIKELTKMMEPDKYPNFREIPKNSAQVTSAAPANLPIADGYVFNKPAEESKPEKKREYEEPEEQQLKERLNKLLRGEF